VIALFFKESDGIRPFWYAVFAFALWFAMTHGLDPHGQAARSDVVTDSMDDWAFSCGLLFFYLGHGMVAGEYRDGHIEFLDGLPLSRWKVYVAKVAAALLPLIALIIATGIIKWVACWMAGAPHALDPTAAIGVHIGLFSAVTFGFLGLGFGLSWLGGLGWGLVFLGLFFGMFLSLEVVAVRPYMPLMGIMEVAWDGPNAVQVWGPFFFWILVGLAGFAASGLLFLGPGRFFVSTGSWLLGGVRVGAVGCATALFLFIALLAFVGLLGSFSDRLWVDTRTVQTEHFRWLYRASHEEQSLELIDQAEEINARVAAAIGNEDEFYLDIEILSAARYHAGVYMGGKIRLADDSDRSVLAHELAHAHAFAICGWAAHHQGDHVRFFQEGLAEYYTERVFPGSVPGSQFQAAAIWKTGQARFDMLVEDKERSAKHDMVQVYPLGRQFVEALVHVEGKEAPACVLRALRDFGAEDIAGISLWYAMMATCEYDLDAVIAEYDARLERHSEGLDKTLPSLTGQVVRENDFPVSLKVYDENDTGAVTMCRFRDEIDSEIRDYEHRSVEADGSCEIPTTRLSGKTLWYQLGFQLDMGGEYIFGEWTSAPL